MLSQISAELEAELCDAADQLQKQLFGTRMPSAECTEPTHNNVAGAGTCIAQEPDRSVFLEDVLCQNHAERAHDQSPTCNFGVAEETKAMPNIDDGPGLHEPNAPDRDSLAGCTGTVSAPVPMLGMWYQLLPVRPGAYRRVIVFDTETSGFGLEDEILEIGAVELRTIPLSDVGGNVVDAADPPALTYLEPTGSSFHALLASTRPVHWKAEQVHGLGDAELRDAQPRESVLRSFLRFLGTDSAIVAHNAPFDTRLLRQDLIRCGLVEEANQLSSRTFCSMKAFRSLQPNSASDLESVCYFLQVEEGFPGSPWRRSGHSALVDAVLTAKALVALIRRVASTVGVSARALACLPAVRSIPMPLRLPRVGARPKGCDSHPEHAGAQLPSKGALESAVGKQPLVHPSIPAGHGDDMTATEVADPEVKRRRLPWRS